MASSKFTYHCWDCGADFNIPDEEMRDMEEFYGVGGMFDDHHMERIEVCPVCGSDSIEEGGTDEEEDE